MDIQYLLFLQGLRETAPAWLNALLEFVSELAIGPLLLLLPAVIFWSVSKSAGATIFWGIGAGCWANALVKNTACVYRPWIRDAHVQSSLMGSATGYSFPSGHTTKATALYGGVGLQLKKHTGKLWLCLLCFIPALVTGFARNWVGAHTPQDVVVGFALTLVVILCIMRLMSWVDAHPEKDVAVTLAVVAISAASLAYIALKPYPADYAADGSLIVDGLVMNKDAFGDIGLFVGVALAWLGERRLVRFTTDGVRPTLRVARSVGGILLAALLYACISSLVGATVGEPHASMFVTNATWPVFLLLAYPALFTLVERHLPERLLAESAR